ncbi:hypothetical protein ASPWEDRAFT_166548 [Aspergillus wentii DTO 134E9]|uniref:FAS1 domain-containing protein n=1 Tax=Aspergillus wentii DTO 134E9 TaxID=1073089 RepID=A0A1L9RZX1_ASPWE|nr:uncharacterized protein ASPWEDRAFT_166548 [Aspergillus wentii DTO 134E9]KAI9932897.1 hypothetical protein MW887_009149 [Aspergillus wentii]OJJ40480.1 hypothetical protein ASPWEDRAFT_166548 [Aspergillus wentii DTO 134E9]
MQYKTLSFLFLSATALAAPELQKKDAADDAYESLMGSLNSMQTDTEVMGFATAFSGMTDFEMPTNMPTDMPAMPTGVSLDLPPSSIQSVLATAVPASFLSQMANPSAQSSLVSEIQNGHFPSWYKDLPGDVKTYLSTHYATGAMQTGAGATTTGGSAQSTSGSNSDSTSTGGAPAATGAVAASLAGAAGILGLAVIL